MIAIIDYGSGNIAAIANIYKQLKIDHIIATWPSELDQADRFLLPGVGAFDATMSHLLATGMIDALNEQVLVKGKKALGICVGMQLLAQSSEEGELPGLGWIPGRVRKIPAERGGIPLALPHMGWNNLVLQNQSPLFKGIDTDRGFYFLHNYYFDAKNSEDVLATVEYGGRLPCAVGRDNIFGAQFHPEKSHSNGVALLKNFAEI
jgi:glutamine amidotransferase